MKRFIAVCIMLVFCVFSCSSWTLENGSVESAQEVNTSDVPNDQEMDMVYEAPVDFDTNETASPTENDADDAGISEHPGVMDTNHVEPDDSVRATTAPANNMQDNNVGQTVYDPYELPED